MEKTLFWIGLIFSILIHTGMIGWLSLSHAKTGIFRKPLKSIEVTYLDVKFQKEEEKAKVVKDVKIVQDPKPYQDQKVRVLDKEENMFAAIGNRIRDISKLSNKFQAYQKKPPKMMILDIDRKIILPPLNAEKITNPKYLTYSDDMRETISRNIKQRAYRYVNHPDFEAGEVYLTFILASSGILKQVKIIENKSSANDYLRQVALRSIKGASPFPPFPKGFDYPEFTFNLLISFQN